MERKVGLWINHHKAVIVSIANKKIYIREIISNVEKQKHSMNSDIVEPPGENAVKLHDPHSEILLDRYYDVIISLISDAESIWIFGPDEAKIELEDQLRTAGFGARVVGIETVAEMTNRQLALKVQQRFLKKRVSSGYSKYSLNED
ncbi:MAG: hypothetical protein Q7U53_14280 [Anaerolineaceae bacterium]|nr:hypothetical protein [Anaerolineaceae bacterium]